VYRLRTKLLPTQKPVAKALTKAASAAQLAKEKRLDQKVEQSLNGAATAFELHDLAPRSGGEGTNFHPPV